MVSSQVAQNHARKGDDLSTLLALRRLGLPGFSAIEAFICSECGEGAGVARMVQQGGDR
jgi:hypothetical protein